MIIKFRSLIVIFTFLLFRQSYQDYIFRSDITDLNDSRCRQWNYLIDENQTPGGKSTCASDCDCDGRRICINGCCAGWPRVAKDVQECDDTCLRVTYDYDEAITQNKCSNACQCGGNRFCSTNGYCHGTATFPEDCLNQEYSVIVLKMSNAQLAKCDCSKFLASISILIKEIQQSDKSNEEICDEQTNKISLFTNFNSDQKQLMSLICQLYYKKLQDFEGINILKINQQDSSNLDSTMEKSIQFVCKDLGGQQACDMSELKTNLLIDFLFGNDCNLSNSLLILIQLVSLNLIFIF